MEINVIPVDNLDSFSYFILPEQHHSNSEYFRNQVYGLSNTLTDIGRKFMETSKEIYETINNTEAIKKAKAALRYAKGIFNPNRIVSLETVEDFQTAQPVMQRYLMADIVARQMYQNRQIDGYSDTYIDIDPGKIGMDHYDYRRVIEHCIMDSETPDGKYEWEVHSFGEDLVEGDRELETSEKVIIMNNWDIIRSFLEAGEGGEDPTNLYGGEISI